MFIHAYRESACSEYSDFLILFFPENTFEVKLLKNSSGLGFSFSREDNVIPEQMNTSIVRVKKLFPGQPAAESGQIDVGDVILKVNGASLKGLSQQVSPQPVECSIFNETDRSFGMKWFNLVFISHSWFPQEVISALRGTSPEVSLLLCRPPPGVLPEIDPALSVRLRKSTLHYYRMSTSD